MKSKKKTTGAKDIFFSHDANAASDPKMLKLLFKYGMRGYGWYWRIVEAMRREEDQGFSLCVKDESSLEAIAAMLSTPPDLEVSTKSVDAYLQDCCNRYQLFVIKNDRLYTESLVRRMQRMEDERGWRIKGGKSSAAKRRADGDDPNTADADLQLTSKSAEQHKHKHKLKHKEDLSLIKKDLLIGITFNSDQEKAEYIFAGVEKILSHELSKSIFVQYAWINYMEVRRKKKWIVTARAAEMLWTELIGESGGNEKKAVAIIDQSIMKPYRSFFPLNKENLNRFNQNNNGNINERYAAAERNVD